MSFPSLLVAISVASTLQCAAGIITYDFESDPVDVFVTGNQSGIDASGFGTFVFPSVFGFPTSAVGGILTDVESLVTFTNFCLFQFVSVDILQPDGLEPLSNPLTVFGYRNFLLVATDSFLPAQAGVAVTQTPTALAGILIDTLVISFMPQVNNTPLIDNVTFSTDAVTTVPEPGAFALLCLGLAACAVRAKAGARQGHPSSAANRGCGCFGRCGSTISPSPTACPGSHSLKSGGF